MSTRYGIELAYRGTNYAGWQRQPNAVSVEETIDSALSLMLGSQIKLVGCGRTDRGVHASRYFAHFDFGGDLPENLTGRLNRFLADDIAIRNLYRLPATTHARFSATGRSYVYRISLVKDPFRPDTVSRLPALASLDRSVMEEVAALLPTYGAFEPFCKTNSDAYTMLCTLTESRWTFGDVEWTYSIAANRFLRGMVRLIVGACIRAGQGRLTIGAVRKALDDQTALSQAWSAPAEGLYLCNVNYPDRSFWQKIT